MKTVAGMAVVKAVDSAETVVTIFLLAAVPGNYVSVSLDYHCPVASGNCCSPGSVGCFSALACSWAHTHQPGSHQDQCPMCYLLEINTEIYIMNISCQVLTEFVTFQAEEFIL